MQKTEFKDPEKMSVTGPWATVKTCFVLLKFLFPLAAVQKQQHCRIDVK